MKRKIIQHEIEPAVNEPTIITVPRHSKLLKVHSQNGEHIFVWFLIDVDSTTNETWIFYTIPTDWELAPDHPISVEHSTTVKYMNSIFIRDGEIVFHVFCAGPLLEVPSIM